MDLTLRGVNGERGSDNKIPGRIEALRPGNGKDGSGKETLGKKSEGSVIVRLSELIEL